MGRTHTANSEISNHIVAFSCSLLPYSAAYSLQVCTRMVKGNNAVPHQHHRKHWNPCSSQRGNIKVWLDQPKRKERRRRLRLVKAKKIFPRPLKALRPSVACPTVRYNMKKRLGRGFTAEELKGAGVGIRYAATIGIRVDTRRKNASEESLNTNVQRLKSYLSKLVLFPINHKKVQKGEAAEADQKVAVQDRSRFGKTVGHPSAKKSAEPPRKLTKEDKEAHVYKFLKKNLSASRFLAERVKRAKKKAEKKAEKEAKEKK